MALPQVVLLPTAVIRHILSYVDLETLPSISGTSHEVFALALTEADRRMRDQTKRAIMVYVPMDTMETMGVTAVGRLVNAHKSLNEVSSGTGGRQH